MASTVTKAYGYTFSIDGVTAGQLLDGGIPIPEPVADEIDDTNQDSGNYYELVLGRIKGGSVTAQFYYNENDTGQAAFLTAYANDPTAAATAYHTFVLTLPGNKGYWTYSGWVKKASHPISGKLVTLKVEITLTGSAVFAKNQVKLTTPFFSLTDQSSGAIASTAIVPVPAAAPGTFFVYVANTVTGVKVTPTCATANAVITVNGTTVATGVASGSNAVTTGLTTIPVIVTCTGYAPSYYLLTVGVHT
jgi:hypothetical protein